LLLASFRFHPRLQRMIENEIRRTDTIPTRRSDLKCQLSDATSRLTGQAAAPANHVRFDPCAGLLAYTVFRRTVQLPLSFCFDEDDGHAVWDAPCLQQMSARVPQEVGTITLALFVKLDLTLRWRTFLCLPISWPSICVEFSAGAEIVAGPGVVFVLAPCLGLFGVEGGRITPLVLYPSDFPGNPNPFFGFYVTTPPSYGPGTCFQILLQQFVRYIDNRTGADIFQGLYGQLQIPTCSCPAQLLKMNAHVYTFNDLILSFGSITLNRNQFVLVNQPAAVVSLRSGGTQAITITSISFDNTSILAGDVIGTKLRVRLNTAQAPPSSTATVSIQRVSASPGAQTVPVSAETTVAIPDRAESHDVTFNITAPSTSATGTVTYSATICGTGNSQLLTSPTASLLVTGSAPPPTIQPERLRIATGGTNPDRDDIMVSPNNAGIQETFVANLGGQGQMATLSYNPTTGSMRAVSASPQDSSAVWRLRATINGQLSSNGTEVIVPPQLLIQVLIGEDITDLAAGNLLPPQAVGVVIRNRINDSRFPPTTYNGVILQPGQFASTREPRFRNARMRSTTGNVTAYDNAVTVAADVYGLVPPLDNVTLGRAIAFGSPGAIPGTQGDIALLLMIANTTPCPAVYRVDAKTLGFDSRWYPDLPAIDQQVILISEIPVQTFAFIRERPSTNACAVIKAGFFDRF